MDVTVRFIFVGVIASLGNCQVFTVTTDTNLAVCELESLPLSFSLMCAVDPPAAIIWEVTGVPPPLVAPITRGVSVRSFTYPNVIGQSLLNVSDPSRVDVGNQTCFICRTDDPVGNMFRSDPLCVDVAGPPVAPSNIMLTLQMATWTPSLPDLWYTVTVCRVDGTNCSSSVACTGCSSRLIPGIVEGVMYNVTVCSYRVVNGVSCMETCASITTEPMPTPTTTPMGMDPASSSPSTNPTVPPLPWIITVIVVLIIIIVAATLIIILIIFVYWKKKQGKGPIAERMTAASNHEEMQDRKEQNKTEELTYVVADFSKAPPTESNKPKKEEPVQYTGVQFPHP